MRTALALAALLPLALANPLPAPEELTVSISNAAVSAADTVPNSYIIVYKPNTADAEVKKYHGEILAKLGKKPVTEYNINGFKAANVQTDAAGLEKIGKSPLVCLSCPLSLFHSTISISISRCPHKIC